MEDHSDFLMNVFLCCYTEEEYTVYNEMLYEWENRPVTSDNLFYAHKRRKEFLANRVTIPGWDDPLEKTTKTTNEKGKECIIGIGQNYMLFFGDNDLRGQQVLNPVKGNVYYKSEGKEYNSPFEINLQSYMSFFSINSNEDDIKKEVKKHNEKLDHLNRTLERIANQKEL